jgi:hypothetical protein
VGEEPDHAVAFLIFDLRFVICDWRRWRGPITNHKSKIKNP